MIEPMLAKPWKQGVKKCEYPVYVQPKLDGIRAIYCEGKLHSRRGHVIEGCPKLTELVTGMFDYRVVDGELFSKEHTFQEISGRVRRTANVNEPKWICYHAFDIVEDEPYCERMTELKGVFQRTGHTLFLKRIKFVDTQLAVNEHHLKALYYEFLERGYEGIIIRKPEGEYEQGKRSYNLIKKKPSLDMEVYIRDFIEGKGKHKGRLGALKCMTSDGKTVHVGSGFDDGMRELLWERQLKYRGASVTIKYQELTDDGIPRFPIFHRIRHTNLLSRK